jgi:uncharacterized membrane protein
MFQSSQNFESKVVQLEFEPSQLDVENLRNRYETKEFHSLSNMNTSNMQEEERFGRLHHMICWRAIDNENEEETSLHTLN